MNQYERSVVHDTAEIAGLVAHSFGQEDIDRDGRGDICQDDFDGDQTVK